MSVTLRSLSIIASVAASCLWAADARRGAMILDDAGCLECHTVHGSGAAHEPSGVAPELGANLVHTYTAPALTAAVWNHTPEMLASLAERGIDRPALVAGDWEDLFAYLYSVQFLEFPAEARRGKETFQTKQCSGCHSLIKGRGQIAKAVPDWKPLDDPLTLVSRMWNHGSSMEFAQGEAEWTGPGWTKMQGRDFMDLTAYIQQTQIQVPETRISLPDPAAGKPLFEQDCGKCHAGPLALEPQLANSTWLDIGAGMWNHVILMRNAPTVPEQDMRKILAYVWELQYRGPEGDRTQGQQVFSAKGCAGCHGDRGVGKPVTPATLAGIGWGSGRKMHERMQERGIGWPALSAQEVADLAAYMSSVSDK